MEGAREASLGRGKAAASGGGPAVTPMECAREGREPGIGRSRVAVAGCGPAVIPTEFAMEGCNDGTMGRGRGINAAAWTVGPACKRASSCA
uniref:Uncharacterized protein n=1 Tax=Leersia perrieri TaxID=77586 RepID=A0A0D9W3L2_9ORYZ